MRNPLLAALTIMACAACDPTIQKFEVVPDKLQCPGSVTLSWKGQADGGRLVADHPVTPELPDSVLKEGTLTTKVTQTTTFKFFYPSAEEREKTVVVIGGLQCVSGPGPSACGPATMTFQGQCANSNSGPSYDTKSITAMAGPGAMTMISNDASFPVHVFHEGQEISLGAGSGPIGPLPPGIPAAGTYTIMVPGQAGILICQGSGPTTGITDAPPVTIHVTPTCPKK